MTLSDPGRLDFIHHYSNVLYTLNSRERLAFIAQLCSAVDGYRPETCCAIGNYYALSKRHEDAVVYFRKALVLDRSFPSAWTLLGHEYSQLQNTHAAVECYRRAIQLDPHDYRSFVGLGQSYETLDKPTFALHYHRQATKLRPRDADLWQSVANCLIGLSLPSEAAKALQSALTCIGPSDDMTTDSSLSSYAWCKRIELLHQLAKLHEETEDREAAIGLLELCVDEYSALQSRSGSDEDTVRKLGQSLIPHAQVLLAQWAMDDGDFGKAQAMACQVDENCEYAGDARSILEASPPGHRRLIGSYS